MTTELDASSNDNGATPDTWFAVILQTDGEFCTEAFPSAAALADRLKDLVNKDVSVSCFHGSRVLISKPPLRYLMTAEDNIPLFDADAAVEPDTSGYLGADPVHLAPPPAIESPRRSRVAQDEFFSDDDDDALGIFDSALPDPDA